MLNRSLKHWCLLLLVIGLFSCKKDDPALISADFFANQDFNFSYESQGDNVVFFLDCIGDETDDSGSDWPKRDIWRIYVDAENNGAIDPDRDLLFALMDDGRVCVANVLSQSSVSGCSFFQEAFAFSIFSSTENSGDQHVNHQITIPRSLLPNTSKIGIVIDVYDPEDDWQSFPSVSDFFTDTFTIDL